MKIELDDLETKFHALLRFATDLSHRTQETDFVEDFREFQSFVQRCKTTLKELIRKTNDNQTKFQFYSEQIDFYQRSIDQYEENLDELLGTIERWNEENSRISMEIIEITNKHLTLLINEQSAIDRQANLCNELTENLFDSVENHHFFR